MSPCHVFCASDCSAAVAFFKGSFSNICAKVWLVDVVDKILVTVVHAAASSLMSVVWCVLAAEGMLPGASTAG